MEDRARELGRGGELRYVFPALGQLAYGRITPAFLNASDLQKARELSPKLDEQMVASIHLGCHTDYYGGGAVALARELFNHSSFAGFAFGAVNTETNARRQDVYRALEEAGDLNEWLNERHLAPRLHLRAASFCFSRAPPHLDDLGFTRKLP